MDGFDEIKLENKEDVKIIYLKFKGSLTKQDYEKFVPQLDWLIERSREVRILVELVDFKGWSLGALWEDTKFGARHFTDIARLAIVGERRWHKGMTLFIAPFTLAKVKYFDTQEMDTAKEWIRTEES
jgi:hypothetical protein